MDFNKKKQLALEKSVLYYNIDFKNESNLVIENFLTLEKYRFRMYYEQEKDLIKLENYVIREMYNELDDYIFNPKHHKNKYNHKEYDLNTIEDEKIYMEFIGPYFLHSKINKVKKLSKIERECYTIKLNLLEMYDIGVLYLLFELFIKNESWFFFPPKQKFYEWIEDHNYNYLNLTFPEGRIKEKFIPINFFFVNEINKKL